MYLDHRVESLPGEGLANCIDHLGNSCMLEAVVIPHNPLLQGFRNPYLSIESCDCHAIDVNVGNLVSVASRLDLLKERFFLGLGALNLPHVEREVFVGISIEMADAKEMFRRLERNFIRHRQSAEAICSGVVFSRDVNEGGCKSLVKEDACSLFSKIDMYHVWMGEVLMVRVDTDLTASNNLFEMLASLRGCEKLLSCDSVFKLCIIELARESTYDFPNLN